MATIYPTVLDEVERACGEYRRRSLTLDELKAALWKAASEVVAHDERSLRAFLQWAEGQLDMVQFTTDDAYLYGRTLEIVERVEEMMRRSR
jgi:hypothetical protein